MADNSSIPVAVGNETFANKDIAGVKFPKHIPHDSSGAEIVPSTAAAQASQLTQETAINTVLGTTAGAAVTTDVTGTLQQYLRGLVKALGSLTNTTGALNVNLSSGGSPIGTGADAAGALTTWSTEAKASVGALAETAPTTDIASSGLNGRLQRIAQRITSMIALFTAGRTTQAASLSVVQASFEYETVAASATDQILGAAGGIGDYLEGLLCVVATAATSQVQIKDGNGSAITVLPNAVGAGVGTYYVPVGLLTVNATTPGWKVTTAAGVSVIGTGKFT